MCIWPANWKTFQINHPLEDCHNAKIVYHDNYSFLKETFETWPKKFYLDFGHISTTYGVKKFKTDQKGLFLQSILKIIIHKFIASSRTLQKFWFLQTFWNSNCMFSENFQWFQTFCRSQKHKKCQNRQNSTKLVLFICPRNLQDFRKSLFDFNHTQTNL